MKVEPSHHNLKCPAASTPEAITIEVSRKWPKRDAVRHGGAIRSIKCPTPRGHSHLDQLRRTLRTQETEHKAGHPVQARFGFALEKNHVDEIMRRMKALLRKPRLSDSVRCQCGWEWQSAVVEPGKLIAFPAPTQEPALSEEPAMHQ